MKKLAKWGAALSIAVFVIAWGVMGVKLLNHDYRITAEAYTGLIALIVLFISVLLIKIADRCPHCGKTKQGLGKYCPHCGGEIR